jgi:histone H3/H4
LAPAPTPVPVSEKPAEPAVEADKKMSRQQTAKLIGISLPVSRVRKYIDKNNINADIESACAELKTLIAQEADGKTPDLSTLTPATQATIAKAYAEVYDVRRSRDVALKERLKLSKNTKDVERLKTMSAFSEKTDSLTEKLEYVSKLRCRFSNDAAIVLSCMLDYIVQRMVKSAMVQTHTSGKIIMQVQHVVQGDFVKSEVYPLVQRLDVVQKTMSGLEPVLAEGPDDDKEAEDVEDVVDDEDVPECSFEFYVNRICKNVKAKLVETDKKYAPVRISKNIKKFCSDVIVQLIERVSPLIKLYAYTTKVRTVNEDAIKFVFKALMIDAGGCADGFCAFSDDRLKVHKDAKTKVA